MPQKNDDTTTNQGAEITFHSKENETVCVISLQESA